MVCGYSAICGGQGWARAVLAVRLGESRGKDKHWCLACFSPTPCPVLFSPGHQLLPDPTHIQGRHSFLCEMPPQMSSQAYTEVSPMNLTWKISHHTNLSYFLSRYCIYILNIQKFKNELTKYLEQNFIFNSTFNNCLETILL